MLIERAYCFQGVASLYETPLVCFLIGILWRSGQLSLTCSTISPSNSYAVCDSVGCSGNTMGVWLAGIPLISGYGGNVLS